MNCLISLDGKKPKGLLKDPTASFGTRDAVLAPILDKKLIYDNSACRIGKGTHFAIGRVSKFLHDFHNKQGANGYFLKCDIRKFF